MRLGLLIVLATPWPPTFFQLRLVGTTMPWTAVAIAAMAAVVLELGWQWVSRAMRRT